MEGVQALELGLQYLVQVSYVSETEVFKTCLDYWGTFVPHVYSISTASQIQMQGLYQMGDGGALAYADNKLHNMREVYSVVLMELRSLMIARMAKPEEVIIVEDENGNIVRETMKDVDVLAQYK